MVSPPPLPPISPEPAVGPTWGARGPSPTQPGTTVISAGGGVGPSVSPSHLQCPFIDGGFRNSLSHVGESPPPGRRAVRYFACFPETTPFSFSLG